MRAATAPSYFLELNARIKPRARLGYRSTGSGTRGMVDVSSRSLLSWPSAKASASLRLNTTGTDPRRGREADSRILVRASNATAEKNMT